ncbi:MAG TPA: S49 family peptidase, partial [Planctomycetes bacterium]|nr:S49 family peptidase [Planctomycetota bacterium]
MIDKAILAYITEAYWAMEPRTLDRMLGIITRHAEGIRLAEEELVAALDGKRQAKNTTYQVVSGNAIIPINGVIAKHASQVGGVSQPRGTSVEAIRKDLRAALEDPTVERIVLSIDSPGGSVSGIAEMADEIFLARQQKPIIAHTEGLMASAAYWLGSQANEVYATKSASVGSIGVYATIADDSRRMKNEGFDLAVLKSGSFKGPDKITGGFGEKQAEKLQEEIDL